MRAQKCGEYHPLHARCTPVSRPILFSGAMVRALLAGTKTQTRRVVSWTNSTRNGGKSHIYDFSRAWTDRGYPSKDGGYHDHYLHVPYWHKTERDDGASDRVRCRWESGDMLWVRETFHRALAVKAFYRASHEELLADDGWTGPWTPAIHMPRELSRITLRITDVRVERLQDISEADARAEGISWNPNLDPVGPCKWASAVRSNTGWNTAVAAYEELWESINGAGSWASNPFVWAIAFEKV